jgi:heme exporter protein D
MLGTWGALFWLAFGMVFATCIAALVFAAFLYYRHEFEIKQQRVRIERLERFHPPL